MSVQSGHGEGRQPLDAEPLVFPRQHLVREVDLLVYKLKLNLWEMRFGYFLHVLKKNNNKKTIKTPNNHMVMCAVSDLGLNICLVTFYFFCILG